MGLIAVKEHYAESQSKVAVPLNLICLLRWRQAMSDSDSRLHGQQNAVFAPRDSVAEFKKHLRYGACKALRGSHEIEGSHARRLLRNPVSRQPQGRRAAVHRL